MSEHSETQNPKPNEEQKEESEDQQPVEDQPPVEDQQPPTEKKPEETPPPPPPPDDEIERVIPLSELKDESEYDEEEISFMEKLYEDTMLQIKSGEIIAGKVVSITDREVAIDIGFKSEGTVPIEEFEDPKALNIGDTVEVYLEDIEDQDGQLGLSKRRADFARVWSQIMGIYERGETVVGKCQRRIKGGIVADVMGVDAFLPGSQIDIHPVRDFDAWIGKSCDFRIVKVNEVRKNIVLSRKVLIEDELRDVREKILSEIEIGQDIEGIVKNITDFGAFVDLGGVDGLLHITDISWGRINHPSEVIAYDQTVNVRILDFDPVRKRISIGLKQLNPHPWEGVEDRFPVNSKIIGKIVSITKYGAFVELEQGVEGLIHISEMSWTQHIKHPSQILNIGQEVEIVVLSMDVENRKVSLGLKQTEEDPWEALEKKYAVESKHLGIVRDLVPFGAFVELEEGVEGLVHISDLSWTRKIRHPGEIVKKGDEIEISILSFDRNERRIALGHKQTIENPWDQFEKEYSVGSLLEGTVSRTVDKGAIVELPLGLESFLPISHFGKDPQTSRGRELKEGDQLNVEVIDFDKGSKKVVVSASAVQKRKEDAEYQEYLETQAAPDEADEETPQEAATAETEVTVAEKTEESDVVTPKEKKIKKKAKAAAEEVKEEADATTEAEAVKDETVELTEPAKGEKAPKKTKKAKVAAPETGKEKKPKAKPKKKAAPKKDEKAETVPESEVEKPKKAAKKSATKKKAEKPAKEVKKTKKKPLKKAKAAASATKKKVTKKKAPKADKSGKKADEK